ncbi:hypothetical protein ACLB2K_025514 [Fragaria x ananassa]
MGRCWASKSALDGETLAAWRAADGSLMGESVRAGWRDSRAAGRCWASKSVLDGETFAAWRAADGRVSSR